MIIYRWILLRTRGVPHKIVEKIKTHVLSLIFFFRKSCLLWNNVERYGRTDQASDDYIIWCTCSACWITKATGTHSIYNTHCLSTATMVMRTLSNNTLYVHRPSFLTIQFTLASIMSVYAYLLRIVIANCKMPSKLPFFREISRNAETCVRQLLLLESLCIANSTLRLVLLYRTVFYEECCT
jgi:hypothetical protein